ncbi:MAG: hypothetical protein WCO63_15555 [Bacteroidota bacterium]
MYVTSETKAKKATRKFFNGHKLQVFIHGPFRSTKGQDFWRVFVGETLNDTSCKYNYKMFGPEERVRMEAQKIADDQKLTLAN